MTQQLPIAVSLKFLKSDGTIIDGSRKEISVPAGTSGTWRLSITRTGPPLAAPARFAFARYNMQFAGKFQTTHPNRRDYVSCGSTDNATWSVSPVGRGDRFLTIELVSGQWNTGETVEVYLGDMSSGGYGSEVFWTTTRGRIVLREGEADEQSPQVSDDYFINVTHRDTVDLVRVLGPTTTRPDYPFDIHIIAFDINRNVVEDYTGTIALACDGAIKGLPDEIRFEPEDKGVRIIEDLELPEAGVYRISAAPRDPTAEPATGNPIVCRRVGKSVYWGDLHNHGWGDDSMYLMHERTGKIAPRARHLQARTVGRFDYAAVGAMAMPDDESRDEIWADYQHTVKDLDEPGRYVPFLGMEMHPAAGDRMLFFKADADAPLPKRAPAPDVYSAYADRADAMLECHIGGSTPKYRQFAPENESLVEVTSAFGNAEWLLQKMLTRGYTPAVTGASDLHLGLLGAPRAVETFRGRFGYRGIRLGFRDSGFGSGPIGALVADSLDRDSLWQALETRSGYATTGDRIFIEIEAGGHAMGEIADLGTCFALKITVHGETELERIDLIVGEYRARSFYPDAKDFTATISFDRDKMPPGRWFYLRVRERNNEYGWSAPVWFADGELRGDTDREWPAWNHTEKPEILKDDEPARHQEALEHYLEAHGDRGYFGKIEPVAIRHESMGTAALFVSQTAEGGYPLSVRWFFEFEIPKLRVDWGYEPFGVYDCEFGPEGEPA